MGRFRERRDAVRAGVALQRVQGAQHALPITPFRMQYLPHQAVALLKELQGPAAVPHQVLEGTDQLALLGVAA